MGKLNSTATYALNVLLGATLDASYQRNLNNGVNELKGLDGMATKAAKAITATFAAAAAAATIAISGAVDTYREFEQEMATVTSISGAAGAQYGQMEEAALDAGRSTIFTATEAASALEYMSLAGWESNESVTALMPVLKATAATGAELGTTSDLITDSMSALGLGVDELNSYLDKMIATNNNANTTAESLMQAMIKTGGASRVLGADLDDTITALGILANNGIKAEEAGTALNSILSRIAANDTAMKELDNIGVSIFDDSGKFIGLEESLIAINSAMADFTEEQRSLSLKNIAGTQRFSQMEYLVDAVTKSAETGESAWSQLEDKVGNSTGALNAMYKTTTDTLENAMATLESAKEDMQIRFIDAFSDDAKESIQWLAAELPKVTDSLVAFAQAHRGEFADALEGAGTMIKKAWDIGVTAGTWIINHKGVVVGALTAIATALITVKTITAGLTVIGAIAGLANPLGLMVMEIAVVAAAITGIAAANKQAYEKMTAANLAEHFGQISLSLEELDMMARQIIGEDTLNGVAAMLEAVGDTQDSLNSILDTWKDIQKESWKLKADFVFDEEDSQTYASELDSYINEVEQYAVNKGYEIHVAASLLFGEGSTQDIEAGAFYADIQEQIIQQGNELHDYLYDEVNGALLDGIIDIDEDKVVQDYLQKMNSIASKITEAENQAKFDTMMLSCNLSELTPESFAQFQEIQGDYLAEVAEGAKEAYQSTLTYLRAKLNEDDSYTQEMFDKDAQEAKEAYFKRQGDAALMSINYMLDTINQAYPELEAGIEQYQSDVADILSKYSDESNEELMQQWGYNPEYVLEDIKKDNYEALKNSLSDDNRAGLSQLLEQVLPSMQQLGPIVQEYNEASAELPEDIAELLDTWQLMYDLVNADQEQSVVGLSNAVSADGAFQDFLDDMGYEIDDTYLTVQEKIEETYSNGFDVATDLRVRFDVQTSGLSAGISNAINSTSQKYALKNLSIYANAAGGIYDSPILTTFAEDGPEAAVPLDGSDRAKSLWVQAGQILGMFSGGTTRDQAMYQAISSSPAESGSGSSGNIQITYNPSITIQGNASKEEVQGAVSMGLEELKAMLKEVDMQQRRVSFG